MTTFNLPIPGLPALLAVEYPQLDDTDYTSRDFPGALFQVWFTTTGAGTGSIDWTVLYDPEDDGLGRGQWASGTVNVTGAGEHYGVAPLFLYTDPSEDVDLAALHAAQEAAGIFDAHWIRATFTGFSVTNVNIHFVIEESVVTQFPRDDGLGYSSIPQLYPLPKGQRLYGGYQ